MLAIFDKMRIEDDAVRDWFREVLRCQTADTQRESREQRSELQRQHELLVGQQDRLLNLRLIDQIDEAIFARKSTELRDRLASIKLQLDVLDRSHDETAELALKGLSHSVTGLVDSCCFNAAGSILESAHQDSGGNDSPKSS